MSTRTTAAPSPPTPAMVIAGWPERPRSMPWLGRPSAARAAWPSWWPSGLARSRSTWTALEQAGRLLPPLDHPSDPAHMLVTGTGLSHLGSAEGRDKMHRDLAEAATLTDSMRMFKLGLEGGKPGPGREGVQPEWFYKGDGSIVAGPGGPLRSPSFALDGGEEPEIVGPLPDRPRRHALAHRLRARQRVLRPRHREAELPLSRPFQAAHVQPSGRSCCWAATARRCPRHVAHPSRRRGGRGRSRSCRARPTCRHTIENLERHHFKYPLFRRPGDVHAHFFGTSTLSFSDGFKTQPGDVFEIEVAEFGRPLRNALEMADTPSVAPRALD